MERQRIFAARAHWTEAPEEPPRTVVTDTPHGVVVAWHVAPGQTIRPHVHPHGQDTWVVLEGRGRYIVNADGDTRPLAAGDIAVAAAGQVHGAINDGEVALRFVSVVAPVEAGYALV